MPHTPDFEGARNYALGRLQRELPGYFTYHNLFHTQGEVLPAALRFATGEGLNPDEISLVTVAAAFHDIGYLWTHDEHELAGARLAVEVLPGYGFEARQVEQVMGMIVATRLPQCPRGVCEAVLADADLDVLGRDDFAQRNADLHQELMTLGRAGTLVDWYRSQVEFLRVHSYYTPTARRLRGASKQRNLEVLVQRLRELENSAR